MNMTKLEAINNELDRLHQTYRAMLENPDRVLGDVMHSDIWDKILDFQLQLKIYEEGKP